MAAAKDHEHRADLRGPLLACCERHGVKGTLLLAREGINGTVAGSEEGVHAVLAHLRADPRLARLPHKASWSDKPPFLRMKVRLKKEIVTLHVPELDPNKTVTLVYEVKDGGTETRIVGELKLDLKGLVPRLMVNKVTGMVEDFVGRMIQPNFQKTTDALTAYLESQKA